MEFFVVDYSKEHNKDNEGLKFVRRGKFIQVRGRGKEFLVMSPQGLTPYHANIAERFFKSIGIEGKYSAKRDKFSISHPEWRVIGGGHWALDEADKFVEFTGTSMAYGNFDANGLDEKIKSAGAFETGFDIKVKT